MALSVLLLMIVFAMINSEDTQQQLEDSFYLRRRQNECIDQTRVDPDTVIRIRHGNWKNTSHQEVKDWSLCVLMKAGLMTKEGVYKLDAAMAKIPKYEQDEIEDLIDACLSSKAIPAPEIAYKFMKCFQATLSNRSEVVCGV